MFVHLQEEAGERWLEQQGSRPTNRKGVCQQPPGARGWAHRAFIFQRKMRFLAYGSHRGKFVMQMNTTSGAGSQSSPESSRAFTAGQPVASETDG